MSRPNDLEMANVDLSMFHLEINSDTLIPICPLISLGDEYLDNYQYTQIYSFEDISIDKSILLDGYFPATDNLFEVVVNKTAFKQLKKKIKGNPLGIELNIHSDYEYHFYTDDDKTPVVTDFFVYDKQVKVVGVVDDFEFLSTPKIFYPFIALKQLLIDGYLNNLSTYKSKPINWYDRIYEAYGEETISAYSYRLFCKDYKDYPLIENYISNVSDPFKMESLTITLCNTLKDLFNAATIGMELFLVIALIGTALIMGILSYSSYSEDRKTSAILTCLGANKNDIFTIYLFENLTLCLVALIVSFVLSPLLALLINNIIDINIGFSHVISIPYLKFLGIYLLLPLIIVFSTLLICVLSTYIPLMFSKKISPKEELMDE